MTQTRYTLDMLFHLLILWLLVTVATPSAASATCGDPGASPSIKGLSFAGAEQWAGKSRQRKAIIFNGDCTVSFAYADETTGSASWNQTGDNVTMNFNNYAMYTGKFDGKDFIGSISNPGTTGEFAYSPMPKSHLRLYLWSSLDQKCSGRMIRGSAAGSSLSGSVTWADGKSAGLTFRLKPDCSADWIHNLSIDVFWGQADGVVMISVDDHAAEYVGRWSDAGMSGMAKRKDGVMGTFNLQRLEW